MSAWRFLLRAMVCLLVTGIVALATEAKHSQYHPQERSALYLSKATKMSECRTQECGAVCRPPSVQDCANDAPTAWAAPLTELSPPKLIFFLDSFRFRPPPPSARS